MLRIAANEAISILRQRRDTQELDPAQTGNAATVVQQVADRERLAHLQADLAELPERQRAALVLREHRSGATALTSRPCSGSPVGRRTPLPPASHPRPECRRRAASWFPVARTRRLGPSPGSTQER